MLYLFRMVGALSVTLIIFSCSHKISPERPVLAATDFKLDSLPDSEINIPIRIALAPIYQLAEKQVDTLFTSPGYPTGWVQEGCDTRYRYAFRRSPLQIKAAGTGMTLGFTGYYRIAGSTRACVAGSPVSPWTAPCTCGYNEPERRVAVSFNNSLLLQPDYKLKLTVRRNEPKALDKCEICFWGQDITGEVLKGLTRELDAAKSALEKEYGTVDLRPRFQQLWNQLAKGYNLYENGWLQINPQRVRVNNLYAKDDSLYIYLGLSARPLLGLERPAERSSALPALAPVRSMSGFSIFLDARLNYDSLSLLVNRRLVNKEFDFNKGPIRKKFIVKDCRLSGAGNEKMIIRIEFGGTDNGTVYLTGKPVYSRDSHVLELKEVEFDVRSKDALLRTAEWLFSRRIVNEITRNTRFDLASYIDSAKTGITRQLNHEWIKGVRSEGRIERIDLIGIYPTNTALVIRSNCDGQLAMKVDNIDFSL